MTPVGAAGMESSRAKVALTVALLCPVPVIPSSLPAKSCLPTSAPVGQELHQPLALNPLLRAQLGLEGTLGDRQQIF